MPASFFTAISWFRSSASYFSPATPLDRIATGPVRAKNPHRKRCMCRKLMLEQTGNMPESRLRGCPAVEKHDGAGESGDAARGLGLGCLGQRGQGAGER